MFNLENFTYELPDNKIAFYPLKNREESKLLVYKEHHISESVFRDIHNYLPDGSILIFNNTRVVRARLIFHKETGAKIEIFCLEPAEGLSNIGKSLNQQKSVKWQCLVGNASKWKSGRLETEIKVKGEKITITAERSEAGTEYSVIEFSWSPEEFSFGDILTSLGKIPLPPYIKREDEEEDSLRYQTVYAKVNGSVAAPTSGLHFTDGVINCIKEKNIEILPLTLHIGAGTFKPIGGNDITKHIMHPEFFSVSREVIETIINKGERQIISTGTTTMRTLESLYYAGLEILSGKVKKNYFFIEQWIPYNLSGEKIPVETAFKAILEYMLENELASLNGETRIIIVPGYEFKVVDALITNFHQPGSTLLLLVAAFIGEDWKKVYEYAIMQNFRFLSYGDGSLLFKNKIC